MVATTGATPALVAAKAAMLPVPLAAKPIDMSSLVQLYAVPVPEKFTATVLAVLHTTWSEGSDTLGVGFTVMVNTCGVPTQTGPAVWGVTVMVATTGVAPPLVAMKAPMFPVPLPARPTEGVSLVQLNVAPAVPTKVIAVVLAPLHTTWSAGSTTVGVGFTVIVKLADGPAHPLNTGVTVTVATTGAAPPFTPVKAAMLPVPDAANPIEGVSLVQLKIVPPTVPLKVTSVVFDPLQTV
jgi:hypothetical protein